MFLISSSLVISNVINFPRICIQFFNDMDGYKDFIQNGNLMQSWFIIGGFVSSIIFATLLTWFKWLYKPLLITLLLSIISGYLIFEHYLLSYDFKEGHVYVQNYLFLLLILSMSYVWICFEWTV